MDLDRLPRLAARTVRVVGSRCSLAESPLWLGRDAGLRAGEDLDQLAVTTAADDVDPAGGGGSAYLLDVGRRGVPGHQFGAATQKDGAR